MIILPNRQAADNIQIWLQAEIPLGYAKPTDGFAPSRSRCYRLTPGNSNGRYFYLIVSIKLRTVAKPLKMLAQAERRLALQKHRARPDGGSNMPADGLIEPGPGKLMNERHA